MVLIFLFGLIKLYVLLVSVVDIVVILLDDLMVKWIKFFSDGLYFKMVMFVL